MPDKGPSPHPTIPDIDITTAGILKLLQNLDIHKASAPDQISSRVLKVTAESTTPILKTIFTYSMDTGTVPGDWKNANVTPIYKKGDCTQPSNYRPISITSIVSKIFEHILSSRITKHLENNNIMNNSVDLEAITHVKHNLFLYFMTYL